MEIGNIKSWKRAGDPFPKSGQGEVRRVTRVGDTGGALYILKSMHHGQARRPERQERFKREIEALRKLDEPHILKIVDYGYDDRGAPYLVTPFCENGTLENLPVGTVIDTVRRFLLDDEAEGDDRLTEMMEVAGPRWFGAPESRDGRLEDVTLAGDVYSLGKLLHWMFSRRIFDRENHRADRNMLGRGLVDRREYELVHELLDRMIVEQPLARYQTASIAAEAVKGLIQVLEAKGRPILIGFAHRCEFCGQGEYKFVNGPEDTYQNAAKAQALGLTAPVYTSPAQYSNNFFMIAVCNKCSHVQFFRPDAVKGARELWMRKPG